MNYLQMEEYDQSAKYFKQYLQIAEQLKGLPARQISDVDIFNKIGSMLSDKQKYRQAKDVYIKA